MKYRQWWTIYRFLNIYHEFYYKNASFIGFLHTFEVHIVVMLPKLDSSNDNLLMQTYLIYLQEYLQCSPKNRQLH